jgi:hypothetical protein
MYLLRELRRDSAEEHMPELRWRTAGQTTASGQQTGQQSGIPCTHSQAGWLHQFRMKFESAIGHMQKIQG